jgi:hypothetical protein
MFSFFVFLLIFAVVFRPLLALFCFEFDFLFSFYFLSAHASSVIGLLPIRGKNKKGSE